MINDMDEFDSEVYSIVKEIPVGKVITYGQIARLMGKPQHSRKVGRAMSHAPKEMNLPCHRVVNSQGRLAPTWHEQRSKLESEHVVFKKNGYVDLSRCMWEEIK